MKKNVLTLAAMLFMSVAFFSCGGDDEPGTATGSGNGSGSSEESGSSTQTPSGDVTPADEKEYLEKVGREFVNLFQASDYQDIADLGNELQDIEGDGVFEDFIKETETGAYSKTQLLSMANIKGSYSGSYSSKEMKKDSSNGDLNITYTASDKSKWVLQVSGSGSWGKTVLDEDKDWYYPYDQPEITTIELEVPKSINVKLTKNGTTIANVNLNITNITLDKENVVDFGSKMSYNLTAQVKDFDIKSDAEYNAGGKLTVNTTVKKNGKELVSVTVDGSSSMSGNELSNAKADVNVVILNKINVKGKITSLKDFVNNLEDSYDYYDNESKFDSSIKYANTYIDLGLYNNNPTKQATVIIGKDAYKKYSYNGSTTTYFEAVPFLKFADGTTYSFEKYFDETSFKSVTDAFEKVMKEFENLVR